MKALIIGGAGFVGKYLINELADKEYQVSATCLPNETISSSKCSVYNLDILDRNAVLELLDLVQPDVIFHLAAQSSVALSWKMPQLTADINIKGTINLLEAVREAQRKDMKILLIGSGEEYGFILFLFFTWLVLHCF